MKTILQVILICLTLPCLAQPTGHAKIYLEITDKDGTLHFENSFKKNEYGYKISLTYKTYELKDISDNRTGFQFYPRAEYIYKTMMTNDHHIQIVKNKTDTMSIEILGAFNVYFMSIPFQKGHFRLYVNDDTRRKWLVNTLPFKELTSEQIVYNITPLDWSVFQVNKSKPENEYFISVQFEKQQILFDPVNPENDPNFRNPRRINNLKVEVADYNFDGQKDYREHKVNDSTQWNYFIYKDTVTGFVLDTLLSSLDYCYFDFEKKIFIGSKTTRISPELTQMDNYEYIEGSATLVRQMQCVHAFPSSEKMDCSVYVLEKGVLVFKEFILGCE